MIPKLDDVHVEEPAPGTAVVVFSGEHDLSTKVEVAALFESLISGNELIVADFSTAVFVDSSMIHVLLNANDLAHKQDRTFRLQLGTASIVRRAFELLGVFTMLDVAPTREAALGERR